MNAPHEDQPPKPSSKDEEEKQLDRLQDLIKRMENRDPTAWPEFFRDFEPLIQKIVRRFLRNHWLRRHIDSVDLQQSVVFEFQLLVEQGRVEARSVREFIRFLETIIRHRFIKKLNHYQTAQRDVRRVSETPVESEVILDFSNEPSMLTMQAEIRRRFFLSLTSEERHLIRLRSKKRSWAYIAALKEESVHAVRMRYSRLVERLQQMIRDELG